VFPDLTFTATGSAGQKVELVTGGRNIPVTFANMAVYAEALERFRLSEFSAQVAAIARGIDSVVPLDMLCMFTAHQLEMLITGNPDVDIKLLKDKTEYLGRLSIGDKHVRDFWEVLESFSQEERRAFLQFVWARTRLPNTAVGFGKDVFKISDHFQSIMQSRPDKFLPITHTCFFHLELPRYSGKSVMRERLLFAIRNCATIDADATFEGRANMAMTAEDTES